MVLKPMAGKCPVGNASMGHHVGEVHSFTTGKYFVGYVNYLFCEDEIGYFGVFSFVCSLILCVEGENYG